MDRRASGTPLDPFTRDTGRPRVLALPARLAHRYLYLPDHTRNMGTVIQAGRGSGKSRFMGSVIAWQDFYRGVPLLVIDPTGNTIDWFLSKLSRLPADEQRAIRAPQRLRYVDMSGGGGRVMPFPLYYRFGEESHFTVSNRYPDVIRRLDPHLESASMLGFNSLATLARRLGMVLSALGFQVSEATDLLRYPEAWEPILTDLIHHAPTVLPAAQFFLGEYQRLSPADRDRRTTSLLAKLDVFDLDPSLRAMFGAATPGIDWGKVVAERQAVLLDFRHVRGVDERRFKMMWAFQYFFEFVKYRGRVRSHPISIIIDELTELTNAETLGVDLFAKDIDSFINVYSRSGMIWATIAFQEAFQLSERMLHTVMSMGTHILGVTSDMETALTLAKQYFPIDPYRVKRYENVYVKGYVAEQRPVEFTIEEQHYLSAAYFRQMRPFQFLIRPAMGEGDITGRLYPVTISTFDKAQWINEDLVSQVRGAMWERSGVETSRLLEEINQRRDSRIPKRLPRTPVPSVTMEEHYDDSQLYDIKPDVDSE